MSNQRSSGIFVGTGGMSGGDILPVLPSNLLRFRERREGIADRHLAGLVALQPHFFENLAAGDTLAARDEFEQLVALGIGPATSATATAFASLLTFEHVELRQHDIEFVDLGLDSLLLGFEFLALCEKCFALLCDEGFGFSKNSGLHVFPPEFVGWFVLVFPISAKRRASPACRSHGCK